ncbi:hypothetical protein BH24CHL4_BH24CHL4_23410 [soil metagenome]
MITLDTSGLVAIFDDRDNWQIDAMRVIESNSGPNILPSQVMAEIAYILESRIGSLQLLQFLDDVESGGFALDCASQDIPRIRELLRRYADMPLGLADAAVVACAERHDGRVLTLDHLHFGVVARDAAITILP